MIELKLSEIMMELTKKNERRIVIPQDGTDLPDIGGSIADEIGAGPPVSVPRDHLPSAVEDLRAGSFEPLVLTWTTDLETEDSPIEMDPVVVLDHHDPDMIFGSPTLCFLSRFGPFFESIPKKVRAVYDRRFQKIAKEYFEGLRRSGYDITEIAVEGELSDYFRNGMADIGIGLVIEEEFIAESGTWPLDRIITGKPVLSTIRDS